MLQFWHGGQHDAEHRILKGASTACRHNANVPRKKRNPVPMSSHGWVEVITLCASLRKECRSRNCTTRGFLTALWNDVKSPGALRRQNKSRFTIAVLVRVSAGSGAETAVHADEGAISHFYNHRRLSNAIKEDSIFTEDVSKMPFMIMRANHGHG